jgi:hypothetical protein
MNVLAIGNSFSQDATRYLNLAARNQGINIQVTNLYIGGCPLSTHFLNMIGDKKNYDLEVNCSSSGFKVSIKEALLAKEWDYITVQQVSHQSIDYSTYQPYLIELCGYIRKYQPKAKLVIHETWAYEADSQRLAMLNVETPDEMYAKLHEAYAKAATEACIHITIPSGKLMLELSKKVEKVHRDTFHATLGLGRYALALLWIKVLANADISQNSFNLFDAPVTQEEIDIAKRIIMEL